MSKYLKDLERRRTKIIHVYRNGDPYTRASFIILRMFERSELDRIMRAVEEKVQLARNRPICKLFEMNGQPITKPEQVEDGKYYVAASAEPFFNVDYGHVPNWVRVGPVRTDKYANLKYISRREEEGLEPYSRLSASNSAIAHNNPSNKPKPSSSTAGKKPRNVKSLKNKKKEEDMVMKKMSASEHADAAVDLTETITQNEELNKEPETIDTYPEETNNKDEMVQEIDKTQEEQKAVSDEPISTFIEPTQDEEQQQQHEIPPEQTTQEEIPQQLNDELPVEQQTQELEDTSSEQLNLENTTNSNDVEENEEALNNAAIKIQAGFRGYKVRNEMDKAQKDDKMQIDSLDETTEPIDEMSQ